MAIVFGIKLDEASAQQAQLACALAARLGAALRLVHVCEDPLAPVVLGTPEEVAMLGDVRARLSEQALQLRLASGVEVTTHLVGGAVTEALLLVAQLEPDSIVVVGSGAEPTQHRLLGQTAERASRESRVPVLTLRATAALRGWLQGARPLRVLIGADLSRAGSAARALGARLARAGHVERHVVFVLSPDDPLMHRGHEHVREIEAPDEQTLALLRQDLIEGSPEGSPEEAHRVDFARASADTHLCSMAEQEGFDLIVVGQRRRSLIEQLWYGSVARGVLRASPVSVGCAPALAEPSQARGASLAGPGPQVVVQGVGLSAIDEDALAYAVAMARGGIVHLVHVTSAGRDERGRQQRDLAWAQLTRLALPAASSAVVKHHLLEGEPADALLAFAQRLSADLIVLGARRRGALERALIGSVTRAVSESSTRPVLIIPPSS